MTKLLAELRRRKVFRVAALYAAGAWLLIQVADVVLPAMGLPDWTITFVLVCLTVGFPITLVLGWYFDITPDGLRRDEDSGFDTAPNSLSKSPYARRQTIAVLPFKSLSHDEEQEYFADGLTEDIITDLSQVAELLVMSWSTAIDYKDKAIDPRQVGRELDVGLILQGSVRKHGETVRVAAQLINIGSGNNIWSKRYDRDLQDIFTVQDQLTREIVTAMEVELVAGEQAKHRRSKFKSAEAGHLLYKARFYFYKHDRESSLIARELINQFIEMEPESVLGYVWAASALLFGVVVGWDKPQEALPMIGKYVTKSLAIDPQDPQSLATNAYFQALAGDLDKAIESAKMAVEVSPSLEDAHRALGWVTMLDGKPIEAIEHLKRADRVCPVPTAMQLGMIGTAYRNSGQFDMAVKAFEECIDRYPDFYSGRVGLVSTLSMMGDMGRANQERKKLLRDMPGYSVAQYVAQNFYRDKNQMQEWGDSLRKAGVPDGPGN